jgi:cation transport regulator ChaC
LVETAEDREMFDNSVVNEAGPVKTEQEQIEDTNEAASVAARIKDYESRNVTGYLTHEQLEASIIEGRYYSSESDDDLARYRRDLAEASDSDDDLSNLLKGNRSRSKQLLNDSDEDD